MDGDHGMDGPKGISLYRECVFSSLSCWTSVVTCGDALEFPVGQHVPREGHVAAHSYLRTLRTLQKVGVFFLLLISLRLK